MSLTVTYRPKEWLGGEQVPTITVRATGPSSFSVSETCALATAEVYAQKLLDNIIAADPNYSSPLVDAYKRTKAIRGER